MTSHEEQAARARSALVSRLRAAGCVFAEDEARLLLESAGSAAELDGLVARRVEGEPLEVVLGWADFCGLRIIVQPGVFVPRQRSRLLVTEAARIARAGAVLVDLCCGTGALGLAIATRVPGVILYAADIDPLAVACARLNLAGRGRVCSGDLFRALPTDLRGRVDVLVCNAPYVPSEAIALMPSEARQHEPRVALDGGPDGLDPHRRVVADARRWLAPGGQLLVETGELQASEAVRFFTAAGLTTRTVRSIELEAQVVIGARPQPVPP